MCFSGTLVSLMQVYYVKDQQLWLIRISALVGLNVILKWGEKKQKNKTKHGFESCQGNNSHIIFIKNQDFIHILYEALYKLSYQYVPFYESATGRPVTCSQIKDLGVLTQ